MLPLEDRELLNQTLVGLNIDPETITSLMTSFDLAADGLVEDQITPVPITSPEAERNTELFHRMSRRSPARVSISFS